MLSACRLVMICCFAGREFVCARDAGIVLVLVVMVCLTQVF